jgi:hemin uptake protein HemP
MTDQRKPVEPQEPEYPLPPLPKLITSDELFGEERQILIDHAGSVYRLQITKQGKLILTK